MFMGWTSYSATYYKNGKIDRIAEVESLFRSSWNENSGSWEIIKSALVGSTVYSAVKRVCPDGRTFVFGAVTLTSINMKDFYNFSYKDMDESCGPCESKCPLSILELLTPVEEIYGNLKDNTSGQYADEWRKRCYEYAETQKAARKDANALNNLPVGSIIEIRWECGVKKARKVQHCGYRRPIWSDGFYRYTSSLIISHGYKVLHNPDTDKQE